MNTFNQIFTDDLVRLVMLGVFAAFAIFYLIYGAFAAFHAIKFGFKGDLSIPGMIIFIAGSAALFIPILLTLLN